MNLRLFVVKLFGLILYRSGKVFIKFIVFITDIFFSVTEIHYQVLQEVFHSKLKIWFLPSNNNFIFLRVFSGELFSRNVNDID